MEFFKSDPLAGMRVIEKQWKNYNVCTQGAKIISTFMKQDLSVMKAVVVSFQMAPAVSKYMAYNGQNEYFCEHSQLRRICMKVLYPVLREQVLMT